MLQAEIPELVPVAVQGREAITQWLPALEQLARTCGHSGSMHGVNLLLGSRFAQRKQPHLLCFLSSSIPAEPVLVAAVLLVQYRLLGFNTGVFATSDDFGVRTIIAPPALQEAVCARAAQIMLNAGAWLVLITWRPSAPMQALNSPWPQLGSLSYALHTRAVRDTLHVGRSAEETLQRLGKRTRVHLRADRRRFNRLFPGACIRDATAALAIAEDDELAALNHGALDTIDQAEFNHQVRGVSRSRDGFVLGLELDGAWISLIGGWRQGADTWIEWQCNRRGFQKLSLGGVMRTYLFEEEAKRGCERLHFHGGTSHSMVRSFASTVVADLLVLRRNLWTSTLVRSAALLCRWMPSLLQRGNFVLNAVCRPGLTWHHVNGRDTGALSTASAKDLS